MKKNKRFIYIGNLILMVIIVAYVSKYWYQLGLIQGKSMEPSYHNFQFVILKKNIDPSDIRQGDVIVFKCDELQETLVKRVVAVPNQKVIIKSGSLYIDGKLSPVYPSGIFDNAGILQTEVVLKNSEYIVIGDNISKSKDSRSKEVGALEFKDIRGKVIFPRKSY